VKYRINKRKIQKNEGNTGNTRGSISRTINQRANMRIIKKSREHIILIIGIRKIRIKKLRSCPAKSKLKL
jgi:hypothetical protein